MQCLRSRPTQSSKWSTTSSARGGARLPLSLHWRRDRISKEEKKKRKDCALVSDDLTYLKPSLLDLAVNLVRKLSKVSFSPKVEKY